MALGGPHSLAQLPDDDLVIGYRDGDVRAFDALFARHHPGAVRFARAMIGDDGAAEEVVQDAFLAMTRAVGRYECRGYFRTWFMRIVRNLSLNWLEAARIRAGMRDPRDVGQIELASNSAVPGKRIEQREQLQQLERAMCALPDRQREALLLHVAQRMTYQQVAQVMELPINTVKTLIHRARANLAGSMVDEGKEWL